MKERIVELEGYDGSSCKIEVTKEYPLKHWKEGRCWAVWCGNPIYFIRLNKKGQGKVGYCYHIFKNLPKLRKGEKWVHIEKGKLVVDKEAEK